MKKNKYWASYDINDISKKNGHAYIIADEMKNDRKPDNSQLRKFYNEGLKGKGLLNIPTDENLEEAIITLNMLLPRVYYAKSRNVVGNTFVKFMEHALDMTKFRKDDAELLKKDYNQFMRFFEAIVGYHNYFGGRR